MFKIKQLINGRFICKLYNCFKFNQPHTTINKINKNSFCQSNSQSNSDDSLPLFKKFQNCELNLKPFTLNLLKFLERTQNLHTKLSEESLAITEDLYDSPNKDFLKNQLIRLNKQINSYTKELYYYDEMITLLNDLLVNTGLLKEAEELKDDEIKKYAMSEIATISKKLVELEKDIIESLIPEEPVILYFLYIN